MKSIPTLVVLSSFVFQQSLCTALSSRHEPIVNKPAAASKVLEAHYFKDLGAKRVKVQYGPYLVPGVNNETYHGMRDFTRVGVEMPCSNCLITGFLGSLEFPDGTIANANNGMWLHHAVWFNANRTDTTCAEYPDRFIGVGNERSPIDLTVGGTQKAGYYVKKDDIMATNVELMNESAEPREAIVTAEWEFIEGIPDGFDIAQPIWLDVTGLCTNSQFTVDHDMTVFNVSMNETWSPPFTASILTDMPHMHDGGINQELFIDGKLACDSIANYGETAGYITHVGMFGHEPTSGGDHPHGPEEAPHEHGQQMGHEDDPPEHHEHGPGEPEHEHEEEEPGSEHDHNSDEHILHISSFTPCAGLGIITPESELSITSHYDMTEHMAMEGHGGLEPVMGIQIIYVARPREEALEEIMNSKGPELPFGPPGQEEAR